MFNFILKLFKRNKLKIDESQIPNKFFTYYRLYDESKKVYYYDFIYFKIYVEPEIVRTKYLEKQVFHVKAVLDDGTEIKPNTLFDRSNLIEGMTEIFPEIKKHYAKRIHDLNIRADNLDFLVERYNSDMP
jgi:hypothetical protein